MKTETNSIGKVKVITSPGWFDGIPFRGETIPDLIKDINVPVEVIDAKIRIFDLSKEEDLAEYEAICDKIAKGLFVLSREEMEWIPKKNNWMVFLRFLPRYAEMPNKAMNRVSYNPSKGYLD